MCSLQVILAFKPPRGICARLYVVSLGRVMAPCSRRLPLHCLLTCQVICVPRRVSPCGVSGCLTPLDVATKTRVLIRCYVSTFACVFVPAQAGESLLCGRIRSAVEVAPCERVRGEKRTCTIMCCLELVGRHLLTRSL